MSIHSFLSSGHLSAEKELTFDLKIIQQLIQNITNLEKEITKLREDFVEGKISQIHFEERLIKNDDIRILRQLKHEHDLEGFIKARIILRDIIEIFHENQDSLFDSVIKHAKEALDSLLILELKQEKMDEAVLYDLQTLLVSSHISKQSVEEFLKRHHNFFKAKPHKKIAKKISKELNERIKFVEERRHNPRGPKENAEGQAKARIVFIFYKGREPTSLNELRDYYKTITHGHAKSIDIEYNVVEHHLRQTSLQGCEEILKRKLNIRKFLFSIKRY